MRRVSLAGILVSIALAVPAWGAPPKQGVLVLGRSLGEVRLGMTPAQVRSTWGTAYGICRNCAATTWYFNYFKFRPQGAAVRFSRGRVDAVWTLWSPAGWHTSDKSLRLGADALLVNARHGALVSIRCGSYRALLLTRRQVTTVFYVYGQTLWGFGLMRPGDAPCH
jgi:hypothetical protein